MVYAYIKYKGQSVRQADEMGASTCSCSRRREGEFLMDNIVFPQRDDKENTKEASTSCKCNKFANVLCRVVQ